MPDNVIISCKIDEQAPQYFCLERVLNALRKQGVLFYIGLFAAKPDLFLPAQMSLRDSMLT